MGLLPIPDLYTLRSGDGKASAIRRERQIMDSVVGSEFRDALGAEVHQSPPLPVAEAGSTFFQQRTCISKSVFFDIGGGQTNERHIFFVLGLTASGRLGLAGLIRSIARLDRFKFRDLLSFERHFRGEFRLVLGSLCFLSGKLGRAFGIRGS